MILVLTPGLALAQPLADESGDPLPAGALVRLGTGRWRHENPGTDLIRLAFTADGRSLVSAGGGKLCVWDARSGRLMTRLELPNWRGIAELAAAPDGKMVAAAGVRRLMLVDVARGVELPARDRADGGTSRDFGWIGFSPGGKSLIAIQNGGEIRIDSLMPDGMQRRAAHRNPFPLAALSSDGRVLTVWNQDLVERWDVDRLERLSAVKLPHFAQMRKLRMRVDGSLLAVNLKGGGVVFWNPATGKDAGRIADDRLLADEGMHFSPDGRRLVTVSPRGNSAAVHVWRVDSGKLETAFDIPIRRAGEPAISPDNERIAFATSNTMISIYDARTGRMLAESAGLEDAATGLALVSGRRLIATDRRTACIWDCTRGKLLKQVPLPAESINVAVDPGGKWGLGLRDAGKPQLIDFDAGRTAGELSIAPLEARIETAVLAGDGRTALGIATRPGNLRPVRLTWDLTASPSRAAALPALADEAPGARHRIYPSGPYRVSILPNPGSDFHRDPPAIRRRVELRAFDHDRLFLRVEPAGLPIEVDACGSALAISSRDPEKGPFEKSFIEVWEIASGERILKTAFSGGSFALAPDGHVIALAKDRVVAIKELSSGAEARRFEADSAISLLAFSADGRTLAAALENGTALVFDLARTVNGSAGTRALSAAELETYWGDLGRDAKSALSAADRLAGDPSAALALFRGRLKPAQPVADKRLKELLADLDADRFPARQAASRELAGLGDQAAAAISAALQGTPAPEAARRLELILDEPAVVRAPERLRWLRAIAVLERIGTPEAVALLRTLASGDALARETQGAQRSFRRLTGNQER